MDAETRGPEGSHAPLSAQVLGGRVIAELYRRGVREFVVSPGSRSAPLALAAAACAQDRPDARLHVRIDERTAAFVALGLGRAGGRPAAVICSSGTATANYHPAVIEADAAGVPLIVLTADRPPELRGTGANQTIDQVSLYGTAVRRFIEIPRTSDQRAPDDLIGQAVVAATAAWPGPVHVNVPLDEPLLDPAARPSSAAVARPLEEPGPPGGDDPTPSTSVVTGPAQPGAATLLPGRRVMLVAGEGALGGQSSSDSGSGPADTAQAIVAAAGRLAIPLLAEPTSGLRIVPSAIRSGHWLASSESFVSTHQPEVVVLLGRPVLSRAIAALVASAATIVMCDPLARGWDPGRNVTHRVTLPFTQWVADSSPSDGAFLDAWRRGDQVASAVVDRILDRAGISELGVTDAVAQVVPDGSQLVVASSLPIRHLNEVMRPRTGIRVLGNRGASGIDGFTSTAVGAALGHDGPTVALAGDLSMIHDLTGLVIGAEEPLPSLPIVIINNDGGGIFDLLPYGSRLSPDTFRRLFATPHGVPLEGLAMTLGHGYTAVDTLAEVEQVLEDAWATPGVTLIEITTHTPTETARHEQIRWAVDAGLAASG